MPLWLCIELNPVTDGKFIRTEFMPKCLCIQFLKLQASTALSSFVLFSRRGILARFLWYLYEENEVPVLSIDRSNWKFGRKNINILMLSLCHGGMGIPILWTVLKDKRGNSSIEERIELLERFFQIIDPPGNRSSLGRSRVHWREMVGLVR